MSRLYIIIQEDPSQYLIGFISHDEPVQILMGFNSHDVPVHAFT